ncbi:gamma-tubulin complex component 4 isoform X2 [Aethina tumida]|nr:gamma-tubulin complex component 4 isoform X2 [Aethina tumida]
MLLNLMDLALDYYKIEAFNNNVLATKLNSGDSTSSLTLGAYVRGFCLGTHKMLDEYKQEILKLERKFIENPWLSLSYITHVLEKFRDLFSMIKSMLQLIQDENIHGCLLFNRLHKYVNGTKQQVTNASIIIRSINKVFYRHLCNWVIFGDLSDTCDEFFICDGITADENFQYSKQIAAFHHGKGSDHSLTDISSSIRKLRHPPVVRKFFINSDMLPVFVDKETSECILFMGRIVWIIKNDPKIAIKNHYKSLNATRDIWEGNGADYYKQIEALESEVFNKASFDERIEECRIKLNMYLWSILLNEGNLVAHLQLIRDYVALGRAELFQQLITVSESYINEWTTSSETTVLHNLNSTFSEIARKIYGDNEKSHLKFLLTTPKPDKLKSDPWSQLNIYFEVDWPLHIVFHPKIMELYNKLFCYLLRLKKSELDLAKLWHVHLCNKKSLDSRLWKFRHNLMYLINTIQYYLQVQVIEAEFSLLFKTLKNANQFEDVVTLHNQFVCRLLVKTLVLTLDETETFGKKSRLFNLPSNYIHSKVFNVISRLLELCDNFCAAATQWKADLTDVEAHELSIFQERSDNLLESLMYILHNMDERVSGHQLLQLLLQLDFNDYFSKSKSRRHFEEYSTMIVI